LRPEYEGAREVLKEFKAFAMRGNLLDLAVAFILGAAFAALVASFVRDIIMPIIAAVVGEPNFDELTLNIGDGVVAYGRFLTALVSFLLVAFVLFLIIRASTRLQRPASVEEVKMRECPQCLSLIPERAHRCSACTADVGALT
jgi:large conductance mechanosensitive channel